MAIYMWREGGRTPGANTIFYYKFEQNTNDSSGKGNNPTNTSNISYEQVGGQYVVKNTSTSANIGVSPSIYSMGTGDFTFSVWFYPPATSSLSSSIWYGLFRFSREVAPVTGPCIWWQGPSPASKKVSFRMVEGSEHYGPSRSSLEGRRNHIVFTRLSGTCYAYINGSLITSWSDSTNVTGVTNCNVIFRSDYGQRPLTTKGDEAIFEKVGWKAQEVLDYYNQTKSTYGL